MKQTVDLGLFCDAMNWRDDTKGQFSREGMRILFEYLEELEQETGEELTLCPVTLCCDYTEDIPVDIAWSYGWLEQWEKIDDPAMFEQKVREALEEEGAYVGTTVSGSIVYRRI